MQRRPRDDPEYQAEPLLLPGSMPPAKCVLFFFQVVVIVHLATPIAPPRDAVILLQLSIEFAPHIPLSLIQIFPSPLSPFISPWTTFPGYDFPTPPLPTPIFPFFPPTEPCVVVVPRPSSPIPTAAAAVVLFADVVVVVVSGLSGVSRPLTSRKW